MLYDVEKDRAPVKNGVLDPRLVGDSGQPEHELDLINLSGNIRKIWGSLQNLWREYESV
jgi:hypothetical protein